MTLSKNLILKEVNLNEETADLWFSVKLHNEWTVIFKEFEINTTEKKVVRNKVFSEFCKILRIPQWKLEETIFNF